MRDWVRETILKQDLFSRVERGHFAGGEPAGQWVMRDTSCARWWTIPLARFLERHEVRALKALKGFPGMPQLHMAQGHVLVRSWIPGAPLQVAKPSDPAYYRRAFKLLVALHRHGIAHNDLAKEPNWLVTPEGDAAVTDFQLAWVTKRRRRGSLFRLAAREDLRHMLKHKRKYCARGPDGTGEEDPRHPLLALADLDGHWQARLRLHHPAHLPLGRPRRRP